MLSEPVDARVVQVAARVSRPHFEEFLAQLQANGGCARPIRLRGSVLAVERETGQAALAFTTATQPDGVLLKACGCRRQTRCPACAAIYRGDARSIVAAGMVGGKGADASVGDRPAVFVTLTAPSFGAVHTIRDGAAPCHEMKGTCPHGLARGCGARHSTDDAILGQALCPDCYDYEGAVIWNARVNELWRRTLVYSQRSLAARLGVSVRDVRRWARLSFVKVVEFQRRGIVHVHAVVRIDPGEYGDPNLDAGDLGAAVHVGAARVHAPNPWRAERPIVWGPQIDIRPLVTAVRPAVAAYLAKYATKSTHDSGALDTRLSERALDYLDLPPQLELMVRTAWRLGAQPALAELNLRSWAQSLGYRGHWVTKSPTYSTTFSALRYERYQWRQERLRAGQEGDENGQTVEVGTWEYAGTGYGSNGDAWLAEAVARGRQVSRRVRWEESHG